MTSLLAGSRTLSPGSPDYPGQACDAASTADREKMRGGRECLRHNAGRLRRRSTMSIIDAYLRLVARWRWSFLLGVADRVVRASGDTAERARHPSHRVHALHADIWRCALRRAHRPPGDTGGDCAAGRGRRSPDPQRPRRRGARGSPRGAGPDHRPRRPGRDLRRTRRQPRRRPPTAWSAQSSATS